MICRVRLRSAHGDEADTVTSDAGSLNMRALPAPQHIEYIVYARTYHHQHRSNHHHSYHVNTSSLSLPACVLFAGWLLAMRRPHRSISLQSGALVNSSCVRARVVVCLCSCVCVSVCVSTLPISCTLVHSISISTVRCFFFFVCVCTFCTHANAVKCSRWVAQ